MKKTSFLITFWGFFAVASTFGQNLLPFPESGKGVAKSIKWQSGKIKIPATFGSDGDVDAFSVLRKALPGTAYKSTDLPAFICWKCSNCKPLAAEDPSDTKKKQAFPQSGMTYYSWPSKSYSLLDGRIFVPVITASEPDKYATGGDSPVFFGGIFFIQKDGVCSASQFFPLLSAQPYLMDLEGVQEIGFDEKNRLLILSMEQVYVRDAVNYYSPVFAKYLVLNVHDDQAEPLGYLSGGALKNVAGKGGSFYASEFETSKGAIIQKVKGKIDLGPDDSSELKDGQPPKEVAEKANGKRQYRFSMTRIFQIEAGKLVEKQVEVIIEE